MITRSVGWVPSLYTKNSWICFWNLSIDSRIIREFGFSSKKYGCRNYFSKWRNPRTYVLLVYYFFVVVRGKHKRIYECKGWEPTFLMRAFGLFKELSTKVGLLFLTMVWIPKIYDLEGKNFWSFWQCFMIPDLMYRWL